MGYVYNVGVMFKCEPCVNITKAGEMFNVHKVLQEDVIDIELCMAYK